MLAQEFLNHAPNRRAAADFLDNQDVAVAKQGKTLNQVSDNEFVVTGRHNRSMTFIEAEKGVIVVDSFMKADDTAEALHIYFAERGNKEVVGVVVVNRKHTRMGGVNPLIDYMNDNYVLVVPDLWVEQHQNFDDDTLEADEFASLFNPTHVCADQVIKLDCAGVSLIVGPHPDSSAKQELVCEQL